MVVEQLIRAAASLCDDVIPISRSLVSEGSVDVCYNPLAYAWDVHEAYLRRMGDSGARTIILGMNPGPHGMGQMGIPFAATSVVRNVFLVNHCPLMLFSGPRAANITPDKVSGSTAQTLLKRCDQHLREVVEVMEAERVIGVGKFAESRAGAALANYSVEVLGCWHPSPASPLANRNGGADWRANVRAVLP